MKQEKRVIIFCPNSGERQQIVWCVEDLIRKHFASYGPILVQEFDSIYKPQGKLTIGTFGNGELLYIIDRHSPDTKPTATERDILRLREVFSAGSNGASYQQSMSLIQENKIPYVFYTGQFALIREGRRVVGAYKSKLRAEFEGELEGKVGEIRRRLA